VKTAGFSVIDPYKIETLVEEKEKTEYMEF
jgi:hypothetical protein